MWKPLTAVFCVVACIALAACGPRLRRPDVDRREVRGLESEVGEESLRRFLEHQARVADTSYRLRVAGADLCAEEIAPVLGVVAWRRADMPSRQLKKLARDVWQLTYDYRVMHVVPGSPAHRAGVVPGDRLLRLNGTRLGAQNALEPTLRGIDDDVLVLDVKRQERREVRISAEIGCRHAAILSPSNQLVTTGTANDNVVVTMGLVRMAESDADLAQAIAHQMGHQLQPGTDRDPPDPGTLLATEALVRADEIEADRLGLYLMARAGYRLDRADDLLERIAIEEPWMLFEVATHPAVTWWPAHGFVPARIVALNRHLDEIEKKRANADPIEPD